MHSYTGSPSSCAVNTWRLRWCRYLLQNEQSQFLHQKCFNSPECISERDHLSVIKSRSEPDLTSPEPVSFNSKAELSNNTQTTSEAVKFAQERSILTTPIIVLIIIFIFISLLFLLFLFWRKRSSRRRAKYFDPTIVKEREITDDRSLSLESTLLNHNRISEESRGPGSVRSELSSFSLENPIPDIEKELIVEPPLNTHPALKFIDVNNPYPHHPGTRVAVPEIPSPLPSPLPSPIHPQEKVSKRMSHLSPDSALSVISGASTQKNRSADDNLSLRPKESSDQKSFSGNTHEKPKSDVEPLTSSSVLGIDYQNRCEMIKEELDEEGLQKDCSKPEKNLEKNLETETYPWLELFSKIARSKSTDLRIKDINQVVNISSGGYHKKLVPTTQDNSDQIHLISSRWSRSTAELPDSPTNSAADWNIPGSWINSSKLDEDNIREDENTNGYDISDVNQKSKSQKFIYLNLQSEINSPNPSILDCSEKLGTKNESERDDDNNRLDSELNDSEIERSGTKTWRKWLKR